MSAHGWKTYFAAGVSIVTGAVAVANGDYAHGAQGVIAGLALIGIRGGIAKIIQAVTGQQQ
jgi:hypothetical protein